MQPPRNQRPPKRMLQFQCGRYFLRTIRRDDASDRWASWLSDPWTIHVLNTPPRGLQKSDIVEYIKQFDQRSRLLLGIFDRRTRAHVGIIRLDIDHAAREALVNAVIGEPEHRNRGATADTFIPMLDYMFEEVGLNKAKASILVRNEITIRYLLKAGWQLDQAPAKQVKSTSDGTMLAMTSISITREAWRAWKATNVAQRVVQRINNTERARARGPLPHARPATTPPDAKP
jgi:RimJ/RimL family protein N-acetyltransferase